MNKKFTILTAALALLTILAIPIGMWGQTRAEVVSYTLEPATGSNNSYTGNCDITINGITWNLTGNSQMTPWRIGGKSLSGVDRNLYSKTAISDNISKIEVTHGAASNITINSWTVIVASDADFNTIVSSLTPAFEANATTTINRPDGKDWSNCYYKFVYNITVSVNSNKFLEFSQAKFYKEDGASPVDPTITFNNGNVRVGQTLDLRTLFTSNSTGAVTYSITAGGSYASLDDYTLTGTAVGSVTVKAEQAESSSYNAGEATATITVNPALVLSSIAVTTAPTKTTYNEGETFDPTGMVVTATYTDATQNAVTGYTYSPNVALTTSDTEITISYTESGVTKTTTQAITVNEVIDYVTLPFEWAGGTSAELTALTGVTGNSLGDYAAGNAPYRVQFNADNDYILIKTNSRPGKVTFGVKMIGGNATSTITVQGSADGETFTNIQSFTISGAQNSIHSFETTNDFASTDRYVKLNFTKGSGSNVGVGPISIDEYVEKYAVTLADVTGGTITRDKATAAAGETVTLTATPDEHYTFTEWSVYKTGEPGTTVTVTSNQFTMPAYAVTVSATFTAEPVYTITKPDNVSVDATSHYAGETVTITVTPPTGQLLLGLTVTGNTSSSTIALTPDVNSAVSEYTFTMPAENVTIAATFGSNYTVQFSVNGTIDGTLEATVTAGESTTLPTSTSVSLPTGYNTLAGWTVDQSSTATILTGSYTPTANVTLYAVLAGSATTKTFSFTISASDFNSTSYPANNNEKTTTATATTGETMDVKWTSNQVMLQSGAMQWQKNNGYIYNSTNLGTITNVEITSTAGTFTTYYGTSEQPSSGEAGSDKGFFKTSVGDATGKTSSMVITFQKSITPYCTRVYNKTISKYNNANDGWHLIASPVASLIGNTNMLSNEYDLYLFDQNEDLEWVNYKAHTSTFTTLEPGKGYLYANSAETTLTFAGVPNDLNGVVTLSKIDGKEFSGYNLIGNPYNVSATLDKDFYKMNSAGSEISVEVASGGTVDAMEGVFVVAASDGETVTFTPTTPVTSPAPSNQLVMNLSYNTRGSAIDRAIVRFGEGNQLPKFQLFENSTKVYIPQGGKDYAIVRSEAQGELPINFKAEKNGSYTLSFEAENVEMNYLHLIDNLTGADIDLLQTPSYTFDARTTDYASRFRLMFSINNVPENEDSHSAFAYFNGSEWVINASNNATVQVVDVMGRVILNADAKHGVSTANMPAGVYMLRLVNGNNVKVQKIVVR